ncbi:phage portal protein [Sporomusa sp.]|uniref:phage portal protein n=1 Tax=Sporomusa sp. TaxID=2078658 RepID=UPI002C6316F9|nr:phage portal protein [Sporomusa sp.]HWR07111.1 phage portal protein [Sporomusa sp.]
MQKVKAKVITGIKKAETPTAKDGDAKRYEIADVLTPKYSICTLLEMKEISTILPQCIEAYKQNIAGFGYQLKYRDDETKKTETAEMKVEWARVESALKYMHMEKSLVNVLKDAIDDREACGNGYIEVIRNGKREVVELEKIEDASTVRTTKKGKAVAVKYYRDGQVFEREKRFRRYVQIIYGSKEVWFKEFGDPRIMDWRTGTFDDNTPSEFQANEILHLKIGNGAYGVPRWISALMDMYGSRNASELNYRYFKQGRHLPAAILIKNGRLTEDSEAALTEYASSVEGQESAHKFLLLEAEALEQENSLGLEKEKASVDIEIKSLAEILQRDGLFVNYGEDNRKKVQSSFRLPDLYTGYSKDFNRATADTAMLITEQQVFIPERKSISFIINNLLLAEYELKYVEVEINNPDISNPEDVATILGAINSIGGVAINDTRELLGNVLGKQLENFDDERANLPTALLNQGASMPGLFLKSADGPASLVGILKDLRDLLEERNG